ncbi:MAG: HAMP domain-containing protein, partial [Ilumatobacter sp.]|nr:HAMP domain-containing protein [Ilumatobacter sp.]
NESETSAALNSLLRRFVLVLAILLPLIAIFGVFLARSLTRPAQMLVRSAKRIADGDLTTEIGDLGQNELGDLGRQLEGVARQLESQEQAIIDEEQHINSILSALLPERLIDRVRNGESAIGDAFDTATVVSMVIDDLPPAIANDNDLAFEIADRLNDGTLAIANQYGAERVQRSSASVLYLTGLNKEDARVPGATDFTLAVMGLVAEIGAEFGFEFTARAGMSTGDVATGVLGSSQLSFGVWGDPPGMAMTLSSLALPGQILADDSVAAQLDQTWNIEAVESHPGLADDVQAHVVNGRVEPLGGSSNNPSISS